MSILTIGYLFPTQISEKYSIVIMLYAMDGESSRRTEDPAQCIVCLIIKLISWQTLHHGEVVVERWEFKYAAIQRQIPVSTFWFKINLKKNCKKKKEKETFSYFRLRCIFFKNFSWIQKFTLEMWDFLWLCKTPLSHFCCFSPHFLWV